MKDFKDKVVVITGASSGIGAALAARFAAQGAHVVAGARSVDKLEEVVDSLPTPSVAVACDVSREEDCKRLIQRAVEAFGRIDVLINNAGISMRALFDDVDLEVIRRLMDTNFLGLCLLYEVCAAVYTGFAGVDRGDLVGGRISRAAGKDGLFGFEIRDARTLGDRARRKLEEGGACADRGARIYGFQRSLCGLDGRRFAAGSLSQRGGKNDDGGPSCRTDPTSHRQTETNPLDGLRRKGHADSQILGPEIARSLVLQPYGKGTGFTV